MTVCTNHFLTPDLAVPRECERLNKLLKVEAAGDKMGVADVHKALDAVNQGDSTIQTIVFEPAAKVLHVAFGAGGKAASGRKLTTLDVGALFAK